MSIAGEAYGDIRLGLSGGDCTVNPRDMSRKVNL